MRQNTSNCVRLMIALLMPLYVLTSFAADTSQEAEKVANQAIAKLSAWQNQAARSLLEGQKEKFGSTQPFQTAWALLEIQDQNDTKNTQTSMTQLSQFSSSSAAAAFFQGENLYSQGKRNEANAAWKKAADLSKAGITARSTDATSQFYRGAALVRMKTFDEARSALMMAVRGGFDPAMVNHHIGMSYLYGGQWNQAKDAYDLGLSVNPQYAPMYFWRAMAWEKLGRKDNMLIDLDQFVKLAPNAPEAGKARAILKSAGR